MHPGNSSCTWRNCALKSTGKETSDFSGTHTFRSYNLATFYGSDGLRFKPPWASGYPFSMTIQTSPCAYPASCTMGTGALILGMKQPGHDAHHPIPSRAQAKNEKRYTCACMARYKETLPQYLLPRYLCDISHLHQIYGSLGYLTFQHVSTCWFLSFYSQCCYMLPSYTIPFQTKHFKYEQMISHVK